MDTKSKKSRPFLAWMCFFLGFNLFLVLALFGALNFEKLYDNGHDIQVFISGDYKESMHFKQRVADQVQAITQYMFTYNLYENSSFQSQVESLISEGDNLNYWAYNKVTKSKLSNLSKDPVFDGDNYVLPEGYDYYLFFDGEKLKAVLDNQVLDVYDYQDGYRSFIPEEFFNDAELVKGMGLFGNTADKMPLSHVQILLIVKDDIQPIPNGNSMLYESYKEFLVIRWVIYGILGLAMLSLGLLTVAVIKWNSKRAFDRKMAEALSRIWLEGKVLLTLFSGFFMLTLLRSISHRFSDRLIGAVIALGGLWWLYLLVIDLYYNRRQVFTHNLINWFLQQYRLLEKGKPFKKALLMRAYTLLLVESALIVLAVILPQTLRRTPRMALLIFFLIVALGVYLAYRYLKRYARTLDEMGRIMDHTEKMRKGDLHAELLLPIDSDFYNVSQNLNFIQEGITRATEERLKSERMKVELITNVSHDLKTPLTSIISYVELLGSEENLSEKARDYIDILNQKSEKLKTLIQDIFDLSKATSGALVLEKERLDLSKLIRQTLADMEEEMEKTGLSFKARYPEIPIHILGDGSKLYRVFQNLLTNIFKYSLEGSRVYIDVFHDTREVTVTLKNIANYEMNFLESEVTERFVRGDRARTTEGSGLGLAIAKSYVEAMGGSLKIKVDGDLFRVRITFPIHWEEEALEQS